MTQRIRYQHPPIQEALCEFKFVSRSDWDPTIPGYLHSKMADAYSGRKAQQRVGETTIEDKGDGSSTVVHKQGPQKVQFFTEDGSRLISVGENVLSVHMLNPYQSSQELDKSGWVEFKGRIFDALSAYWELAQPAGVNRIGVRYINNIQIPAESVVISDYLTSGPVEVPGFPEQMKGFISRAEYHYPDGVRLAVSQGTTPAEQNHIGLLLDIDVFWQEDKSEIGFEESMEQAADLRNRERDAFECAITDKARELFGVISNSNT